MPAHVATSAIGSMIVSGIIKLKSLPGVALVDWSMAVVGSEVLVCVDVANPVVLDTEEDEISSEGEDVVD